MDQKEFSKQVRALQNKLDNSLNAFFKHQITLDEHMKIHKEWRDLFKYAKDNNLYMQ